MDSEDELVNRATAYIRTSLDNGVAIPVIREQLLKMGVPPEFIDPAIRSVDAARPATIKAGAIRLIWVGLGLAALGGGITAATYSAARPGGSYMIFWGLIVVGVWNALRGLARLAEL
jgi:hypothetical protein